MKRTQLKRKTPLKSGGQLKRSALKRTRKAVNAVSEKRKVENVERAKVLAGMRRAEPWCHARCVRECTNRPDDGHELLSRARGGSIVEEANIILVCRPCHSWLTTHPKEAEVLGLALSRKGF